MPTASGPHCSSPASVHTGCFRGYRPVPPRTFEHVDPADARGLFFSRLNVKVLDNASAQVNTFPSGHASVTFAAALAISSVDMRLGLVFGIVATSITIATVLGRYHYAVDSIVGLLLGVTAWWIGFHLV